MLLFKVIRSSIYLDVLLNLLARCSLLDIVKVSCMLYSYVYQNRSAIRCAQLVPIGIPTVWHMFTQFYINIIYYEYKTSMN